MEDFANYFNRLIAVRFSSVAAEFGNRAVSDLVDEGTRHVVNDLLLLFGRSTLHAADCPRYFAMADLFQLFLQAGYGGRHLFNAKARHHLFHFFLNNGFGMFGLLLTFAEVGVDNSRQIVNVVKENTFDLVYFRIDVPRDRNIDQEHRLVPALADYPLHIVTGQYEVRCATGRDNNIDLVQHGGEARVIDGASVEQARHFFATFVSPIGDEDLVSSGSPQMFRGQFAHLAGPDDEYAMAPEGSENSPGKFDRGIAYRNRHLPYTGFRPDSLGRH